MPRSIQTGRFSDLFRRALGAKSGGGPETVIEDVMPVFDIFDNDGPDCAWQRGERAFVATASVTAGGAGTYSTSSIGAASGSLVIIDRLLVATSAGPTTVYVSINNQTTPSTSATNLVQHFTDARNFMPRGAAAAEPCAALTHIASTPGASVPGSQTVCVAAFGFYEHPFQGVLASWPAMPCGIVNVSVASANVGLIWTIAGRMRALDPSEG